jgi:hypothetical protein
MKPMAMRHNCKHFESRTYANGDTVRKCDLDLAPEAPWRCPEHCPAFELRLVDVDWQYGTLVTPPTPPAPKGEAIAELLDAAEDIVNAVGPTILAEVEAERRTARQRGGIAGFLDRLRPRRRRG